MEELALKFVAFDAISQIAAKIGESLGGLTGRMKTEGEAQAGIWSKIGAAGAATAVALAAVVGATAAIGVGSIKAASDFNSQMMLVRTQAHDTTDNLQQLGQSVLALAPAVGIGPDELAKGLYHVTSVGYRGAEAMQVLKIAAEGSKVGMASLDDTAYALTSTMNTFGLKGDQAYATMATLNAIVGAGDMKFANLNAAIGSGFFAAGETFGVSIQSMGAALAYLTDRGASADEAATRLKMSINLLGAPSKQAAGIMKDLGLTEQEATQRTSAMEQALRKSGVTTTQLSTDLRKPDGIQVALQDLVNHMQKAGLSADETAAVLSKAFGGGRSGAAIMSMVQHLDTLKSKFDMINEGQARFGADWQDTLGTFNSQLTRVRASLDVVAISWGQALLPIAAAFMALLADHIVPAFASVQGAAGRFADAWETVVGRLRNGSNGAQAVFQMLRNVLHVDLRTAAPWANQIGPTLDQLVTALTTVRDAFRSLFADIRAGTPLAGSEAALLPSFLITLGMGADDARSLLEHLGNTWANLREAADELWPAAHSVASALGGEVVPAAKALVPILVGLAEGISATLAPALKLVADHANVLVPLVTALGVGFVALKTIELASTIATWATSFAAVAMNIGKTEAVMSALGVSTGMQDALGWARGFGKGVLEAGANFASMTAAAVVEGAKTAGASIAAAGTSAGGWIATKVAAVGSFAVTSAAAAAEAAKTAAAWLAAQARIVAGWIATQAQAIASYVAAAAAANPNSNAAAIMWIAGQIRIGAGWLATQAIAIASFVATAAAASVNALKVAAAWVATQLRAIGSFIATAAGATVSASMTAGAFLAAQARIVAGWLATRATTVASFVATSAAAAAMAGLMVARFVLVQGAMLGIRTATLLWAGAQVILDAALDANPIGVIIMAVAALVTVIVLLVMHWKDVVHWLGQVWDWIKRAAGAISDFIDKHRALAVAIALVGGPITIIIGLVALLITHWQDVQHWAGVAWESLKSFGAWLASTFGPIIKAIGDAIGTAAGKLSDFIAGAKNVPVLGGAAAAAGVPGFASGGIVTRPTLALLGEAGPEMVVPLSTVNRGAQAVGMAPALSGASAGAAPSVVEIHSHLHLGDAEIACIVQRIVNRQVTRLLK